MLYLIPPGCGRRAARTRNQHKLYTNSPRRKTRQKTLTCSTQGAGLAAEVPICGVDVLAILAASMEVAVATVCTTSAAAGEASGRSGVGVLAVGGVGGRAVSALRVTKRHTT